MTVVPFRPRSAPAPSASRFRVELVKGTHKRVFEIIPNVGDGRWQSWMRLDGRPLRSLVTDDPLTVKDIRAEYEREIAALLADGWRRGP